jgi:serine phosphatase RsbU (regulator of sigma subunit)
VIRLSDSPELVEAQSIMMSGVRDVLCVPIVDAREIWGFLYLVRSHTGATSDADDAADFCVAIGRLAEIALSSLRRRSLEQEIVAARQAQERLMPAVHGTAPGLQYAMVSRPGRGVAGDLLDVVAVDDRRTVALLGDITGKGAGPALLMSAAQAFLNGALRRSTTLLETVEELNAYLVSRSLIGEFLTLWIGLYDADAREIEYVDAGHGFAAMATAAGETSLLQAGGGPPLGLETGSHWTSERRRVEAGDRLLLFSDGLAEQRSPAGKFFGLEAAIELFAQSESPTGVIASLDEAARTHAGPGPFSDDFTIVCIEFDAR